MSEGARPRGFERLRSLPEFIHYIVTTARSHRRKIARLAQSATCPVRRLNSDEAAAALVEELRLQFATKNV